MSQVSAPDAERHPEPLCALCNAEVPAMAAIIYHGVVYHPACVAPTLGPSSPPARIGDITRREQ